MNDLAILSKFWKDKYAVYWCNLCLVAYIVCEEKDCHGSSCNGMGCDKCKDDFQEFNQYTTKVEHYLTPEEIKTYERIESIKKFILETIREGEKVIDFKKLQKEGKMSGFEEKLFRKELE